VVGNVLQHTLSTFVGHSGSPLLVQRGDKFVAIAIHKGAPPHKNFNEGRLITKEVMRSVLTWENEMAQEIRFNLMKDNVTSVIKV
jgi:V8-like Glu-specific endopeptidase